MRHDLRRLTQHELHLARVLAPALGPFDGPRPRLDRARSTTRPSALQTTFWVTTRTSSSRRPMPPAAGRRGDQVRQVIAGRDLRDPGHAGLERAHAAAPSSSQRARSAGVSRSKASARRSRGPAPRRPPGRGAVRREAIRAEREADVRRRGAARARWSRCRRDPARSPRPRATAWRPSERADIVGAEVRQVAVQHRQAGRSHRRPPPARLLEPGVQAHAALDDQRGAHRARSRSSSSDGRDHHDVVDRLAHDAQHPLQQARASATRSPGSSTGARRVLAAARPRCGTMIRTARSRPSIPLATR